MHFVKDHQFGLGPPGFVLVVQLVPVSLMFGCSLMALQFGVEFVQVVVDIVVIGPGIEVEIVR